MVFLLDAVVKALEQRNTVAQMCLIDFKKTFDNIDHSTAVTRVQQCTKYKGQTSTRLTTTNGAAQGTCISPVIFLAVINNLLQNSSQKVKFVDDVTVYKVSKTAELQTNPLKQLVTTISMQCKELKLIPNPNKCELLNINFLLQDVEFSDVQLDGNIIPCVSTAKMVGLIINSSLTWQDHIDHIITKASKRLFMLFRARSFGATQEQQVQLYCRPILQYACPV
ncbi:hypothetical protein O3P69_009602 [Scylla paramamosain]|uniref:Reverse transcriptase domain-containing protein n=1 Tax=Scylla paramamosain TaxID=85552 RepID=A0AAW0SV28_SCYPA